MQDLCLDFVYIVLLPIFSHFVSTIINCQVGNCTVDNSYIQSKASLYLHSERFYYSILRLSLICSTDLLSLVRFRTWGQARLRWLRDTSCQSPCASQQNIRLSIDHPDKARSFAGRG